MTEQEKREKVIRGLECCLDIQIGWKDAIYVCQTCPYTGNETPCETLAPLMEDALALLKAQEPPTDVSISSAIECLLHPQDADDSDMAKAIDTAVRAMRLLKAQEPVEPEPKEVIYDDVHRSVYCPSCDNRLAGLTYSGAVALETEETPNYCWMCGQAVKWE